jgi:2-amino-4-hydroxy-6-hydroxymethyldihydropteridine diphosphokinase
MVTSVYLSLGSNLGDRAEHLRRALETVEALPDTRLVAQSSIHETAPWGVTDQPSFLNMAAEIETALGPLELLNAVKTLESSLGRTPGPHWGPRVIDIDIVLWQDTVMETDALTLPHPRFRDRAFVLLPLREIAPNAVDPVTGRTVAELAAALDGC